ncbi:hypothetical protein H4F17_02315 [Vibrio cholerae]
MDDNIILMEDRQLIPRWHTSRKAFQLSFPNAPREIVTSGENDIWLIKAIDIWKEKPTLPNAIDLFVRLVQDDLREHKLYSTLSKQLIKSYQQLPDVIKNLVCPKADYLDTTETYGYSTSVDSIRLIIKKLKALVEKNPRDSWSWMDLGFYYSIIGETDKAEYHVSVARNLDINNSFISRAYTRHAIHSGDPELAEWNLRKNPFLKSNPMLLSAYIALCSSYNIGRNNVSDGRKLLSNWKGDASRISELLACIGTIDIKNGSIKKGKKLVNQALVSPSENVISHISWLNHKHKVNIKNANHNSISLERNINDLYSKGNFKECRSELMKMYNFQPYSSASISDAGYLSIVALQDMNFVKLISENRVPKSHMGFSELNNLIVAKMLSNELDDIHRDIELLRKKVDATDVQTVATFNATCGMLFFSIGNIETAQQYYDESISLLSKHNNQRSLCVANYFYSMMLKDCNPEKASFVKKEAVRLGKKLGMLEIS